MSDTLDSTMTGKLLASMNRDVPTSVPVPKSPEGALEQGVDEGQKAIDAKAPIAKEGAEVVKKDREQLDKSIDDYHDNLKDVDAWKPEQHQTDPLTAFGKLSTTFAMLAAGLTHTPMVNAMNAAASAVNARRANDETEYKKSYDAWKENTDLAIKKNKSYMDHVQLLGEKAKEDPQSYQVQMQLAAQQHNDKAALAMGASEKWADLAKLNMARAKTGLEMEKIRNDLVEKHEARELEKKAVTALGPGASPEQIADAIGSVKRGMSGAQPAKITLSDIQANLIQQRAADILKSNPTMKPSDALMQANSEVTKSTAEAKKAGTAPTQQLDDQTLSMLADQWKTTGQIPNLGYGKDGAAMRKQVVEYAAKKLNGENKDFGDVILQRANLKADQSSLTQVTKLADNVDQFERTTQDAMGTVDGLIGQGAAGGGWPVVNTWVQAGRKATGDPKVAAFNDALQTVASEYAKIMSGSTSAAGASVHVQQVTEELLDRSYSPEMIQQIFNTMRTNMNNRQSELDLQKKLIGGRMSGKTTPSDKPSSTSQYVEGGIYTDANGNKAKYQGGKWVDVQ